MDRELIVYKIDCEWDMGFEELYISRDLAEEDIERQDWEGMVGMSLEEARVGNLVKVIEIMVTTRLNAN